MEFKINHQERLALRGLPYLQRLLYLEGIRPYMDYATGIVGIKRGISYQSLAEEMYVEPHQGYSSGSPSRDQIRRALKGLEKSGLIESQNHPKKLIFKCLLATQDTCVQNKAAIKPPHQAAIESNENLSEFSANYENKNEKAAIGKMPQAAIPPVSGNNYIFLSKSFEIFWNEYPEKKSKQKAWEVFQMINPSQALFKLMLKNLRQQKQSYFEKRQQGQWVANWKHPTNWLSQQCWEDEDRTEGELKHEVHTTNFRKKSSSGNELLWESCKSGFVEEKNAEIIQFAEYRR